MPGTAIEHIHVRREAIDFVVLIDLKGLTVSSKVADRILGLLPGLASQVCVGGAGDFFGDEIAGTETAHLLEHVTIELLGRAYAGTSNRAPLLMGHTSWIDELADTAGEGYARMQVSVSYHDDLVTMCAFNEATQLVEWAFNEESSNAPDVEAILIRLRAMM